MLSYQHGYHAGNRSDIHKHDILCHALAALRSNDALLVYVDTHAGQGLYDLEAAEAKKTGEAAKGWLKLVDDQKALEKLSPLYVEAVRALNGGKLSPCYPGSAFLASHILRAKDSLYLMELHPAEYAALKKNFAKDKRANVVKQDGVEGALTMKTAPSLVFVDPSYEIKTEYETIPDFAWRLNKKWPKASILIWAPMLPAKRHETLVKIMKTKLPKAEISETTWANPDDGRGMYGSIMIGINQPLNAGKP